MIRKPIQLKTTTYAHKEVVIVINYFDSEVFTDKKDFQIEIFISFNMVRKDQNDRVGKGDSHP